MCYFSVVSCSDLMYTHIIFALNWKFDSSIFLLRVVYFMNRYRNFSKTVYLNHALEKGDYFMKNKKKKRDKYVNIESKYVL